jgi:dihydroxyacetone kinase-like predicted kinase
MKSATALLALGLCACGADVATTTVTVSKLQAEEARQARERMEQAQKMLDEAQSRNQRRLEQADDMVRSTPEGD